MESKTCSMCKIEKHINNFSKNIRNVKIANPKEVSNFTKRIKIKYETNER